MTATPVSGVPWTSGTDTMTTDIAARNLAAEAEVDITAAVDEILDGAPGALDTLNELAAALGDDANYAATVATALAGKQPLDSDLTAIAALSTTATGRALLTAADAAALRTALGIVGPGLIVPPALVAAFTLAPGVWPTANRAFFCRFSVQIPRAYRYANFPIGVQSGNIQIGVVHLTGSDFETYDRVMDSGIIACPAAGPQHYDLGATTLAAGDYACFLWADNTTVTMPNAADVDIDSYRLRTGVASIPAGVPANGTFDLDNTDGRWAGFTLEAVGP